MIILKYKDLDSHENLIKAAELVRHNGLVVYPTDTLYGLGGDFFSESTIVKIDQFKGRSNIPYSIIVSDMDMMAGLVDHVPEFFIGLSENYLPGKYTFLFKASATINRKLLKGSEKIGIRIPDSPAILRLIKQIERPLITTSVNVHGFPPLNSPRDIIKLFEERQMAAELTLLIDKGPLPASAGSTIIDLSGKKVTILRQGDDFHKISSFLQRFYPD